MDDSSINNRSNQDKTAGKTFPIKSSRDLVDIRDYGRNIAGQIGFSGKDQTLISTVLSEICRNVLEYAGAGKVLIEADRPVNPSAIQIEVSDKGPGIENIELALREGYSTGRGLGIGLPGAKRIMDEFEIESEVGKGTTIKMDKRLDNHEF